MSGDELEIVDLWIRDQLDATAVTAVVPTARMFSGIAPAGTAFPWIGWEPLSATDLLANGMRTVWSDGLWIVRVFHETTSWVGSLRTAAAAVHGVLHGQNGDVTGGRVVSCVREQSVREEEPPDAEHGGRIVRSRGGIYRIQAQSLT